jgi:hypothetical protein
VIEVAIGRLSADRQHVVVGGVIRDASQGQTYLVVQRDSDGKIVRRWVPPDSPLVDLIPWPLVIARYTVPTAVLAAIPLDDQPSAPGQVVQRFDGVDDRLFAYDAALGQWRHVPDIATFQALGFFWCDVTAADFVFFQRLVDGPIGPPYPVSDQPVQADYPDCRPAEATAEPATPVE